jgi:hypothetical protein
VVRGWCGLVLPGLLRAAEEAKGQMILLGLHGLKGLLKNSVYIRAQLESGHK